MQEFSADPDRYYRVRLFEEQGFVRVSCAQCGRYFWTLDGQRTLCPDDSEDTYSFIGDPPTAKRFDYTESWRQIEQFFVHNGHTSVSRYPVVCRWRDDLYFTVASIVDFQRVMGSKVVFEFPANPLIVPQTCLRFKDLENVGVTGRHFSSFCMIGQHSIADKEGYWRDRCIELDFGLLTDRFGIPKEEIVFVEDVWAGGGSFGSSLEYFVRGLELGNAVFTEFQGDLGHHTTLDQKIIDMGAGLERFAWITMGTPTAYDCSFGPVMGMLYERAGIDPDSAVLRDYYTTIARSFERLGLDAARRNAARRVNISDDAMSRIITPLEGLYMVSDHIRTLVFAIADGALPSNVGGGYNLRMMLRRIRGTMSRLKLVVDVDDLVDAHVDYLSDTYAELDLRRSDVKKILEIESARYAESRTRMGKIASRISQRNQMPSVDELITLYESDGVTPDYLKEAGAISQIPSQFYSKLSELHQSAKNTPADKLRLSGIAPTRLLFYDNDPFEFEARVLRVLDDRVILDRTSFYARGGGQEPDHGTIGTFEVTDVEKHADIILHKLAGGTPAEGDSVLCRIDARRRSDITRHHTSTHIINAASRQVLGSWVWQHSAFKDADHARLDITHHSSLTDSQVQNIQDAANRIVMQDLPVTIQYLDRGTAEQQYGFSIYQGGVVPVKSVRTVSIGNIDTEACGGTHVASTRHIGLIQITKTKRIQDGVVRIEFVSGDHATQYQKSHSPQHLKTSLEERNLQEQRRQDRKTAARDATTILLGHVEAGDRGVFEEVELQGSRCFTASDRYDRHFHIKFGKQLVKRRSDAVYCAVFRAGSAICIVAYCGADSGMSAVSIQEKISTIIGGTGAGNDYFAQGGGKDDSRLTEALSAGRSVVFG